MKIYTQQLLLAALASGLIKEALARAILGSEISYTPDNIDNNVKNAISDVAPVDRKRTIGLLSGQILPQFSVDEGGDDGDSSLELFDRSIAARGESSGHSDGHSDGHGDGTGDGAAHDGATGGGTGEGNSGSGQQSGTTGGLSDGHDSTEGGLTSGGDGKTDGSTKQPPPAVCKRDECKGYDANGYPISPAKFSANDERTLTRYTTKLKDKDNNTPEKYKSRYASEREKFAKYRDDPAQEAKDEQVMLQKFKDNYEVKDNADSEGEFKPFPEEHAEHARALGINTDQRVKTYEIFSKRPNGEIDGAKMYQLLVTEDGKNVISTYSFASHDGNAFKLKDNGDPEMTAGGFVRQDAKYVEERRLSNSNVNWAFLNKITNGDKKKAQEIQFWMREHIVNSGTIAQIYRSHKAMNWGSEIRGKFAYNSKNPQEVAEYQALMGTENLSPVGYMYGDHAQYFDSRYPLEIYTYPFDETNMWVKIGKPDGGNLPKVN